MSDNKAKRRRLYLLMNGFTGYCAWCDSPVVVRKWVEDNFPVVFANDDFIVYLRDGRQVKRRVATVDHVVPRSEGGANDLENLLPACGPCNRKRTETPSERKRRPCRRCGGKKPGWKRYHCLKCARELIEAWRAAHPEDFLPDPDFP
jgi:hypothetical protein